MHLGMHLPHPSVNNDDENDVLLTGSGGEKPTSRHPSSSQVLKKLARRATTPRASEAGLNNPAPTPTHGNLVNVDSPADHIHSPPARAGIHIVRSSSTPSSALESSWWSKTAGSQIQSWCSLLSTADPGPSLANHPREE